MTQNPDPNVGQPHTGYQPPMPPPPPSSLDLPPLTQQTAATGPGQAPPTPGYAPPPTSPAPGYGQSQSAPYATPTYGQAYQPNPTSYPTPSAGYSPVPQVGAADPDVQNNKVMAVLAYLGILVLIPMFAAKDSGFARFHTNQGLTLFIGQVAIGVFNIIISSFWLTSILSLLNLGLVVLAILGIINAVSGKRTQLPITGKIKLLP